MVLVTYPNYKHVIGLLNLNIKLVSFSNMIDFTEYTQYLRQKYDDFIA